MTQSGPTPHPPRLAEWLVDLFACAEQAESILGDLQEEFSELALKSGVVSARRWYWRQGLKTIFRLAGAAFRIAPWSFVGVVLFGFLLRGFSFSLAESLVVAILRTQRPYSDHHVLAYMNFQIYGTLIAHLLTSALVGSVMGIFAKGREVVAALTLTLLFSALVGNAWVHVARRGSMDFVWMFWSFADPWAIVFGGIIEKSDRPLRAGFQVHEDVEIKKAGGSHTCYVTSL